MRKLKLEIEEIRVDSFSIVPEARVEDGTVQAHAKTVAVFTCDGPTCAQTCDGTSCDPSYCIASCWETCRITCGECISVVVCN